MPDHYKTDFHGLLKNWQTVSGITDDAQFIKEQLQLDGVLSPVQYRKLLTQDAPPGSRLSSFLAERVPKHIATRREFISLARQEREDSLAQPVEISAGAIIHITHGVNHAAIAEEGANAKKRIFETRDFAALLEAWQQVSGITNNERFIGQGLDLEGLLSEKQYRSLLKGEKVPGKRLSLHLSMRVPSQVTTPEIFLGRAQEALEKTPQLKIVMSEEGFFRKKEEMALRLFGGREHPSAVSADAREGDSSESNIYTFCRHYKGMSQKQWAEEVGVALNGKPYTASVVNKWENKEGRMPIEAKCYYAYTSGMSDDAVRRLFETHVSREMFERKFWQSEAEKPSLRDKGVPHSLVKINGVAYPIKMQPEGIISFADKTRPYELVERSGKLKLVALPQPELQEKPASALQKDRICFMLKGGQIFQGEMRVSCGGMAVIDRSAPLDIRQYTSRVRVIQARDDSRHAL